MELVVLCRFVLVVRVAVRLLYMLCVDYSLILGSQEALLVDASNVLILLIDKLFCITSSNFVHPLLKF